MNKLIVKDWNGKSLEGTYTVTRKVDGVLGRKLPNGKVVFKGGGLISHLPSRMKDFKFAEIACDGGWEETMSITRAYKSKRRKIQQHEIYPIIPLDKRLFVRRITNPSSELIDQLMKSEIKKGNEGLVLLNEKTGEYIKVKPVYTYDVRITGVNMSKSEKHKGLIKELVTEKGAVGVGMTMKERRRITEVFAKIIRLSLVEDGGISVDIDSSLDLVGSVFGRYIEVECSGLTKNGMFRHARFVRMRPDKDFVTENKEL